MRSINQPRKSHRAQSNYCIFRGAPKDVHRKRAINTYHFPHSLVISCTTSDNKIRSRCLLVWRAHASMKYKSFPHIACWHSETQKSQKTTMFKKRRGARILATPRNLMFFFVEIKTFGCVRQDETGKLGMVLLIWRPENKPSKTHSRFSIKRS